MKSLNCTREFNTLPECQLICVVVYSQQRTIRHHDITRYIRDDLISCGVGIGSCDFDFTNTRVVWFDDKFTHTCCPVGAILVSARSPTSVAFASEANGNLSIVFRLAVLNPPDMYPLSNEECPAV